MLKRLFFNIIIFLILSATLNAGETDSLDILIKKTSGQAKFDLLLKAAQISLSTSPTKTINYSETALKIAEQRKDTLEIVQVYNLMAVANYYLGDFSKSITFYKSISRFLKHDPLGRAEANEMIASIYMKSGNDNSAVKYYDIAIRDFTKVKNNIKQANCFIGIGDAKFNLRLFNESLKYYKKALAVYNKNNDTKGKALALSKISEVHYKNEMKTGDFSEQKEEDLKIREELSVKEGVAFSLNFKPSLMEEIPEEEEKLKFDKTLEYLSKSLKQAKKNNYREIILNNYKKFSDVYIAAGDHEKALRFYRLYTEIRDSMHDERMNQKIAEMRVRFETEKKEREIELLKKNEIIKEIELEKQKTQNNLLIVVIVLLAIILTILTLLIISRRKSQKILEQKNVALNETNKKLYDSEQSLKDLNNIKDRLFSVIANDLKSPINAFLGISNFLRGRIDQMDADMLKDSVRDIDLSAKEIDSQLENLVNWAKIQIGMLDIYPEEVNISELVSHIIMTGKTELEERKIETSIDIDNSIYAFADMEITLTVMKNLFNIIVSNSSENSNIYLDTWKENGTTIVSISSDGIIDMNEMDKNYSAKENKTEISDIGLIVCMEFMEKNNGNIRSEIRNNNFAYIFSLKAAKNL